MLFPLLIEISTYGRDVHMGGVCIWEGVHAPSIDERVMHVHVLGVGRAASLVELQLGDRWDLLQPSDGWHLVYSLAMDGTCYTA